MTATILVADDDAAIRTVLNQALSRAGYDVRITSNAATLWRWISAGEGDLVVTDVVMPDENAFDLLPRIKKARPDLPVLVMSAQNTFMTAIKASEKGAYDYLPKPFDLEELPVRFARARRERGSRRSEQHRQEAEAAEEQAFFFGKALAGVAAETGVVMLVYLNNAWEETKARCAAAGRRAGAFLFSLC